MEGAVAYLKGKKTLEQALNEIKTEYEKPSIGGQKLKPKIIVWLCFLSIILTICGCNKASDKNHMSPLLFHIQIRHLRLSSLDQDL